MGDDNLRILSFDVGIKNLSYCYISIHKEETKLLDWNNISVTDKNCKKIKIEELTECMLLSLCEHFTDEFQADVVVIENQPSLKNGVMKSMSMVIYTYFNLMKLQFGNIREVKFMSATNKLKCNLASELTTYNNKIYKDRKNMSVALAKLYVQRICPEKSEWFCHNKKADDLGDSFLMAIYFVENVRKKVI